MRNSTLKREVINSRLKHFVMHLVDKNQYRGEETGRQEPRRNEGGTTGVRKRRGGRQHLQGGREPGGMEKISQHCTIFCNRKGTQRLELVWKGVGTGNAGCGRWEVQTSTSPAPPPPLPTTHPGMSEKVILKMHEYSGHLWDMKNTVPLMAVWSLLLIINYLNKNS